MACFLQYGPDRQIQGVIRSESGRQCIYQDLIKFEQRIKQLSPPYCPPPYLDFIKRPCSNSILPVDWTRYRPKTVQALRSYQKQAITSTIEFHNGRSLLAADMGTGKTLMGSMIAKHYDGKRLFIVPCSKITDWYENWLDWIGDEDSIQMFTKHKDQIEKDTVIVSYDVARDCPQIHGEVWDFIVLDESHAIKSESRRAKVIVGMIQNAKGALLMSGTPQECCVVELFNQLFALYPDTFNDKQVFTQRYTTGYFDVFNKWVITGTVYQDELNILLSTLMYRIRLQDALQELPRKSRFIVPMQCTGDDKRRLERLQNQYQALKQKKHESKEVLQQILVLANRIRCEAGQIKTRIGRDWIRQIIDLHPKDKFAFFLEHRAAMENLIEFFSQLNIPFECIHQSTPRKRRLEAIKKAANPDDPLRILLLTFKTSALGITLSPGVRYAVFCELAYTPTTMMQAENRVYRLNTTQPVEMYWWCLEGSTDDRILQKIQQRTQDNSHIIDGRSKERVQFDFHLNKRLCTKKPCPNSNTDLTLTTI